MAESTIIIKKKKSHGGHAHHGGSWKVAYADFVTAMMAFFMVMWIMGLSDASKAQIQGYFNDPLGFMKNQPRSRNVFTLKSAPPMTANQKTTGAQGRSNVTQSGKNEVDSAKSLKKTIESEVQNSADLKTLLKYLDIKLTSEGIRIELVESTGAVFFDSGSSNIRPQAMKLIKKIAPIVASTGRNMIIEGHTDAKPYAGRGYTNMDLSTDRAGALRRALAYAGVPENRFLGVRGYGPNQLRNPSKPYDLSNRRVTLLLPWENKQDVIVDAPKDQLERNSRAEFKQALRAEPPDVDINPEMPH